MPLLESNLGERPYWKGVKQGRLKVHSRKTPGSFLDHCSSTFELITANLLFCYKDYFFVLHLFIKFHTKRNSPYQFLCMMREHYNLQNLDKTKKTISNSFIQPFTLIILTNKNCTEDNLEHRQ